VAALGRYYRPEGLAGPGGPVYLVKSLTAASSSASPDEFSWATVIDPS
jgi:hypothetical protein